MIQNRRKSRENLHQIISTKSGKNDKLLKKNQKKTDNRYEKSPGGSGKIHKKIHRKEYNEEIMPVSKSKKMQFFR